jgi:hypothetical protein
MQHLEPGFSRVFTITDYYDGPRGGIANYCDRPHLFRCEWDESADDYSDTFLLSPIAADVFVLALEDWEIWLRWERAFQEGRATQETHPALPDDRPRHEELEPILKASLVIDPTRAIRAVGEFKPIAPSQPGSRGPGMVAMQVLWHSARRLTSR